jgi:hypothetical protein
MLLLVADENFNNDIVRGLLRRKPDLDIVCMMCQRSVTMPTTVFAQAKWCLAYFPYRGCY